MDTDSVDLDCRDEIRWGSEIKVYIRKKRRNAAAVDAVVVNAAAPEAMPQNLDAAVDAVVVNAAAPEAMPQNLAAAIDAVVVNAAVPGAMPKNLDAAQANPEEEEQLDKVTPQTRDVLIDDVTSGDVADGGKDVLNEGGEGDGTDVLNGGSEGGGTEVRDDGGGVDVGEEGGAGGGTDVGDKGGEGGGTDVGEERGDADGTEEVGNQIDRPFITRVDGRIRISLSGGNLNIEKVRELKRMLESELYQVRNCAKRIENMERERMQLNPINSSGNNAVGRIFVGVPGGGLSSRSRQQYLGGDDGIGHRSVVRVKHSQPRPFHPRPYQPPSLSVVVNNNSPVGEYVEREKRTPKANPYYKNSEFLLEKDRLPAEINRRFKPNGGARKDRGVSNLGFSFDDNYRKQLYRSCTELLQRLMNHKFGWVFNEPVNVKALGLHDYLDIIKHPMDFGTIKTRLSQNWYNSPKEFAEDIRLVFDNAKTYNPKGQDVHIMAEELSRIFEDRWAAIEAKFNPEWRYQMYRDAGLPTPTPTPTPRKRGRPPSFVREPVPYRVLAHTPQAKTFERSESITGAADPRKKKPSKYSQVGRPPVLKKPKAKDPNKRVMTYDEKQKLSTNLESLPQEKLEAVIQIIKKRSSALSQNNEEIEVDIDNVDTETLWELDRFVANYKKSLSKNKRKAELALQASARAAQSVPITSSDPMVANALKKSRTGEMNSNGPSAHVEDGRQADNASSSSSSGRYSSDSGSSSSNSDSDSSSSCGSDAED
ncbi:transcription factor GTE4 isoform X1 [Capsicum chacoense]